MKVLRKLFTRNIIEQKKHTYVVDNERIVYKSINDILKQNII